jgi:hypothetical protein
VEFGEKLGTKPLFLFLCRPAADCCSQREREETERGERIYTGIFFVCFFWVQVQRPLVWVWGVQPQPLAVAGVEPLSLPASTKPTTGALVSMRTHPNPHEYPPSNHIDPLPALVIISTVT